VSGACIVAGASTAFPPASKQVVHDIRICGGRWYFTILDANQHQIDRATNSLRFPEILCLEGVAELPPLITKLEMIPTIPFLEICHDPTPRESHTYALVLAKR
jgi:hypothetical protein